MVGQGRPWRALGIGATLWASLASAGGVRDAVLDEAGGTANGAVSPLALGVAASAHADGSGGSGSVLETITVVATGVSNMTAASAGDVSSEQIASQPLLRPGAVLENVPGLIVTQHSGEGKANQYFLRAFNLDHGTDLASEIDDMPVNNPTHAHGQGYSDLNFLIPELVSDLH